MNYRNPTYNANDTIDCEIEHPEYGWIPFTADPNDCEEHGRAIYAQIKADGNIAPYVPPPPLTDKELAAAIRAQRNRALIASDWTQIPDVPEPIQAAWKPYRQALRDITQQPTFPQSVTWPEAP